MDIQENKLIRVGGGGKCGLNCISLHTTGSEELADEIAANKNIHIVDNWETIYKNCFEFPYTERIGGGERTFNTEDEFLTFLLTETNEASAMWMTHTGMQAVSTMLILNISILTTGVAQPVSNICVRCKPKKFSAMKRISESTEKKCTTELNMRKKRRGKSKKPGGPTLSLTKGS